MKLQGELDKLRVQLAGCLTIADGAGPIAREGDYGWSPAYQRILQLRTFSDNSKVEVDRLREKLIQLATAFGQVKFTLEYLRTVDKDQADDKGQGESCGSRQT